MLRKELKNIHRAQKRLAAFVINKLMLPEHIIRELFGDSNNQVKKKSLSPAVLKTTN